jgi:nucleoside-diphosphate-sugar epimerase
VASAYTTGKIEINSDGTPWRPVIHVQDISNAFVAGLVAPAELVANQSFNVGIINGNYSVKQLAEAAQKVVAGSTLVFTGKHGPDSRTYKVSFNKILTVLKDYFQPKWDLDSGAKELVDMFRRINFQEKDFKSRKCIRLMNLQQLVKEGKLNRNLRWV